MPGILPMKVIRVGASAQSRIAQACDRCRSKKIRCDGIRPCCTQCANVGFECKTSDKLSRRAFPRGYTESLEDRVRALEAEVRELKDLLDEKDEKIDMLSRLQSFSSPSRKCSTALSPASAEQVKAELESAREDVLIIEAPVSTDATSDLLGPSSTAAFIDSFDQKIRYEGQDDADIRPANFVQTWRPTTSSSSCSRSISKIPPRLLSDQYINLFFQEWQPLLPVLHRPSFLRIYEDYLADPEAGQWHSNKQAIAQLFLIFEISALSSNSRIKQSTTSYESQWRKALHSTASSASLPTIQCHVLAQLYYLLKADYTQLTRHRGIAVAMCHQLGLHQSHKYRGVSILEAETRKKVFWTQYVLDKFTSASTGTPMLLRDAEISTDYPADIDDENISSQGVSPALPGELTKISSALAFFKVSKILSSVLTELYPTKSTYELSLEKLHSLSDELDLWSQNLPPHLRLYFSNDKPSANVTGCRSPLLSLAYFYTRSLIHRPLVCYGSGSAASASTIVVAAAGKHVLQILDLLDERRMNYTFPFNKSELLLSCGFSLLWQCIDLGDDSKLVKDNQKSLNTMLTMLLHDSPDVAIEFQRVASYYVTISGVRKSATQAPKHMEGNSQAARMLNSMPAPSSSKNKSTRKTIQAMASRFSPSNTKSKADENTRSRTVPRTNPPVTLDPNSRTYSSVSLSSTRSAPVMPMASPSPRQLQPRPRPIDHQPSINLDYFPLGDHSSSISTSRARTPAKGSPHLTDTAWEQLLTNIDLTDSTPPDELETAFPEWTPAPDPDVWSIGELSANATVPQSVMSFSEESLTSNEDMVFSRCASNNGSTGSASTAIDSLESSALVERLADAHGFKGIAIPFDDDFEFHS